MKDTVFDRRTLSTDEKTKLTTTITEGVKYRMAINTENEALKDLVKSVAEQLNEKIEDKELHIKPSLINKLINTKLKDDLAKEKNKVDEIEDGLNILGL
jgi:uncharacterized protein YpuA (DUF1002 family)